MFGDKGSSAFKLEMLPEKNRYYPEYLNRQKIDHVIVSLPRSVGTCDWKLTLIGTGSKYGSSLGKGFNLALFNAEDAKLTYCAIVDTEDIQYQFGEDEEAYWIRDDKQLSDEEYRAEADKKVQAKMRARSKRKND